MAGRDFGAFVKISLPVSTAGLSGSREDSGIAAVPYRQDTPEAGLAQISVNSRAREKDPTDERTGTRVCRNSTTAAAGGSHCLNRRSLKKFVDRWLIVLLEYSM